MKAVILTHCREAILVDIGHTVPLQDVDAGAMMIANAATVFPKATRISW